MSKRILVNGGKGALGSSLVSHFKSNGWWVASIDLNKNDRADLNILVKNNDTLEEQQSKVKNEITTSLENNKFDAIICVAGGWVGGNAKRDLIKNSEVVWRQSVGSSLISADIAVTHLRNGGLLSLTGANSALDGTPKMVGYGMAKSAVHHLVKSLAGENSGMPKDSTCMAILPITLDTPMNRKWMPKADFSNWTVLDNLCVLFMDWVLGKNRPPNGSLVSIVTCNNKTKIVPVQSALKCSAEYFNFISLL